MAEPPTKRRRLAQPDHTDSSLVLHQICCAGDVDRLASHLSAISSEKELLRLDSNGFSPLHFASEQGHLGVVQKLIEFAISKSILDQILHQKTAIDQCTAVLLACQQGNLDIVEYLVKKGADVNAKNRQSFNCLHATIKFGHEHVVKYLISNTDIRVKDVARNGQTVLHTACGHGHVNIARDLMKRYGFDPSVSNGKGWNCLHFAVKHGHLAMVEFLTSESMADKCSVVTARHGCSPLFIACQEGYIDLLKYLHEKAGADAEQNNSNGWNPLHIAAKNGHMEIIRYLLEKAHVHVSAKTKNSGCTPFFISCQCGNTEIARYLYSFDPSIRNAETVHGNSVLHIAAQNGHLTTIRFLCDEAKISPTVQNTMGHQPIVYACKGGHLDCIRILADRGGGGPFIQTCTTVAEVHSHRAVAAWLAAAADWTPLMRAVDLRDEMLVRNLLWDGANPNDTSPKSKLSVLDIATNKGDPIYGAPVSESVVRMILDATKWSPSSHYIWPTFIRNEIKTLLLIELRHRGSRHQVSESSSSSDTTTLPSLPFELWLMIAEHLGDSYRKNPEMMAEKTRESDSSMESTMGGSVEGNNSPSAQNGDGAAKTPQQSPLPRIDLSQPSPRRTGNANTRQQPSSTSLHPPGDPPAPSRSPVSIFQRLIIQPRRNWDRK